LLNQTFSIYILFILLSIYNHVSFIFYVKVLTHFFLLNFQFLLDASSKGQIQPISESVTRSAGDGSKGRRLLVFQTYARKRTTSDPVDGDAYCKETIMIGKITVKHYRSSNKLLQLQNSTIKNSTFMRISNIILYFIGRCLPCNSHQNPKDVGTTNLLGTFEILYIVVEIHTKNLSTLYHLKIVSTSQLFSRKNIQHVSKKNLFSPEYKTRRYNELFLVKHDWGVVVVWTQEC
jgi:hypothetical protein